MGLEPWFVNAYLVPGTTRAGLALGWPEAWSHGDQPGAWSHEVQLDIHMGLKAFSVGAGL